MFSLFRVRSYLEFPHDHDSVRFENSEFRFGLAVTLMSPILKPRILSGSQPEEGRHIFQEVT